MPLSRALGYTTTPIPICQHLFSGFFKKVFKRATRCVFDSKPCRNLDFWFQIVGFVAILFCRCVQVYLRRGRRLFSIRIDMFFSRSPTLFAGSNGNPATGFGDWDGRVSNGVMATGVSVRCFPALTEGGGRSVIAPTGCYRCCPAPGCGCCFGLYCGTVITVPYFGYCNDSVPPSCDGRAIHESPLREDLRDTKKRGSFRSPWGYVLITACPR